MQNPKTGGNRFNPDIRPSEIDTYTETNGEQTAEYKIINAHPIIGGILNKLAFFRTHAAAVYYNRLANKTVKQKFDDVDAAVGELNEKLGKIRYLYYPEIEQASSVTQYLENCTKMLLSSTIPNESTVIVQTSKEPNYYTIIGSIVYHHRVFYGIAYASNNSRYKISGKIDAESKQYSYDIIDAPPNWKYINGYDLVGGAGVTEIPYPNYNDISEFYFSYGRKNSDQSYGGGSVTILSSEIKPACLPVYIPDGNNASLIGYVYIYNDKSKKKIVLESKGNNTLRVLVYYKRLGIQ